MKIYLVGGAVRDQLLGLPVKEQDWVVVGATIEEMLTAGYRQVGKEFPVFLHPKTGEEYALARMERKINPGYKGFTFDTSKDVTLEEDLSRRDLTINAMAETPEGELVDPFHGKKDLEQKILRHVSPAFAEDPVRILRIGRFLARYAHLGFRVAPETVKLMQQMVKAGEVNALVAERVWKELERALSEPNPAEFFAVLDQCEALSILFPSLTMDSPEMLALKAAATLTQDSAIRFAALMHALPDKKTLSDICKRYRVPNVHQELAKLTSAHYKKALQAKLLSEYDLLALFTSLDYYRREDRFAKFLIACSAIASSNHLTFDAPWLSAIAKASVIDVAPLLEQGFKDQTLGDEIKKRRLEKIAAALYQS